jgi:hypothetical protein
MKHGVSLLILGFVFVLGAVVGYGVGFGVWVVTPSQVVRLQKEARHLTERAFGVHSTHPTPSGPLG